MLSTQPILNEQEWALVLELLMDEQQELPVERRRTDSLDYVGQLDDRKAVVDQVIQKIRAQGIRAS